jgi:F-type H+-transporting ATPase subunit b
LRNSFLGLRSRTRIFWFASLLTLASLLIAPLRSSAQSTAPAPASAPAASAPSNGSTPTESQKAAESEEDQFLHASAVQAVGRLLHLNLNTTVAVFLGINFAIIFFAIAIPLTRVGPKFLRKRSETVRQSLQTAREATADAQARLSAVEAKLAGLGEEMDKLRAQVEQDSLEDEKRIKASIGEESARIVAAAEQEIGVAAAQARRGLRNFAADLAIEQASKELVLTPEIDGALIAEFIAGAAGEGSGKGGKN